MVAAPHSATAYGVPVDAPPLDGPVIFDQHWCEVLFLHWPVDPAAVARFLPRGVEPDVVDGVTYVGLVPFRMRRARIGRWLPAPYLGNFGEVNVRLYSVDATGRHGVVFRSLDCSRLAVSIAAQTVGVPYVWSHVEMEATADGWSYVTRRRHGGPVSAVTVTVGEPLEPTPLELFLTARWGMHSSWRGRPVWVPNRHETWPLRAATVTAMDDTLVAAAGVEPVGPMLRPLWSPGVHARFAPPHR